jgi:hypothetical protein
MPSGVLRIEQRFEFVRLGPNAYEVSTFNGQLLGTVEQKPRPTLLANGRWTFPRPLWLTESDDAYPTRQEAALALWEAHRPARRRRGAVAPARVAA